jgi:Major tropism determinant N-terminal domain
MTTRIKLRRDTASNWTAADPVLALGEAGYDTTHNEIRVGDGVSTWGNLSPIGGSFASGMISNLRYGNVPQIVNDLNANSDADNMYFEVQTQWDDIIV